MTKKILIALGTILILGGVAWWGLQQRGAAPIPVDQTSVDTSSWKTYRNEKYGFEIKYPNGWLVKPDGNSLTELWSPEQYEVVTKVIFEGGPNISINVVSNPNGKNFEEWYEDYDPGLHLGPTTPFKTNNGIIGFLTKPTVDGGMADCCAVIFVPVLNNAFFMKFLSNDFTKEYSPIERRIVESLVFYHDQLQQ